MKNYVHLLQYFAELFFRIRNISDKFVQEIKTFYVQYFFIIINNNNNNYYYYYYYYYY